MAEQNTESDALKIWCVIVNCIPYDGDPGSDVYPCLSYEDAKKCLKEQYDEEVKCANSEDYEQDEDGYPEKQIEMPDKKHFSIWVEDEYDVDAEIKHLPVWRSKKKPISVRKNRLREMLKRA